MSSLEHGEEARLSGHLQMRMLAAWEIISIASSALIAEWSVFSLAGGSKWIAAVPVSLALLFVFLSHRARHETARELGLRVDNFLKAARLLALPMLVATVVCIGAGWWLSGTVNFNLARNSSAGRPFWWMVSAGVAWGFLQQYVLQAFINRRAQLIWGRGVWSTLVVGGLFAALHLPNPWLTLATFAGGMVWASVYQRAPNLFALALSHGLMTWVLISTLPAAALNGLRVGFKYFG